MRKILVVYKHDVSFVHKDIELLSEKYDVEAFYFKSMKDIWKLRKAIKRADIIYIWFASYHAFITTLLTRKPKIVVTGGYDVAGEEYIGYGLMLSPVWKRMVRYILKRARVILSVSEFNKKEIEKYLTIKDSIVVYNCADMSKFTPRGEKNNNLILTVGTVKKETWVRKGIRRFVEMAKLLPDLEFVVVGKIHDDIKYEVKRAEIETPNLTFTGYVSDEKTGRQRFTANYPIMNHMELHLQRQCFASVCLL